MDGTERESTAITGADASMALGAKRTLADELQDASAIAAAVARLHALGLAVRALADPDNENAATEGPALDGRFRALEELGAAIAEIADDTTEACSENLLAARCRANATETPTSSAAKMLVCEILDATANLELLAQREPWHADDMVTMRDAIGGLATSIDRAARGALDALERAQA